MPTIDFDSSDSPIYLQLTTIFRRQIALGTWIVGSRIPTIEVLAAQYQVALGTVRQALAFLEREGLIQRKRRRGTTVIKQPYQPRPVALPQTSEEMATLLKALSPATVEDQEDHDLEIRKVVRTYSRGEQTVMLEFERSGASQINRDEPAMAQLGKLTEAGFSIHQTTTIGTADTEAARKLVVPVNAPVVLVKHSVEDSMSRTVVECDWLMRGDIFTLIERYPGPQGRSQ